MSFKHESLYFQPVCIFFSIIILQSFRMNFWLKENNLKYQNFCFTFLIHENILRMLKKAKQFRLSLLEKVRRKQQTTSSWSQRNVWSSIATLWRTMVKYVDTVENSATIEILRQGKKGTNEQLKKVREKEKYDWCWCWSHRITRKAQNCNRIIIKKLDGRDEMDWMARWSGGRRLNYATHWAVG